jgi:hypothetical protein
MLLLFTFVLSLVLTICFYYSTRKNSNTHSNNTQTTNTTNTIYFEKPESLPAPIQIYILAIDTVFNLNLDMLDEKYLLYKINQLCYNNINKKYYDKNIIQNKKDIEIWKIICEKRKWNFIQN